MSGLPLRILSSYRFRLTVGYALVVTIFAASWAWSLTGPLTDTVISQQEHHLRAVAQAGVLALESSSAPTQSAVESLVARTNLRVTVIGADGVVITDSDEDPDAMENHAGRSEFIQAMKGEVGVSRRQSATQGTEQLYVAVPASIDGTNVVLRVSQSIEEIQEMAESGRRTGLVILLVALLVAIVVSVRTTTRATHEIRRLSTAAESMAAGDLTSRIAREPGELAVMSDALNSLRDQMRARLDALDGERSYLKTVLDGLVEAVFMLEGERIGFANRAAAVMFRTSAETLRGRTLDETSLPESLKRVVRELLGDPASQAVECEPDPTGRCLRVATTGLGLVEEGGPPRSIVVVEDITARSSVDRVRRDFVTNASHELKTPAATIQLLADSAANAAEDGDTDQALRFASQISAESSRLNRLVKDLLDLSRLEATPAPDSITDIREAVSNAVVGHRIAADQRGLTVRVDDAAVKGVDVFVAADATDVAVALDNLLENAISYTERGGVTISLSANEGTVRVAVADTGIGIPSREIPRLFERFYRVDRARSRESGGTGLGLSLVRHFTERVGGSVEIESAPGQGSTFTLILPRAR